MTIVKLICSAMSLWLVFCSLTSSLASAQSVFDSTPPVIELEETREGIAGETQVFTALVTDDVSLQDVKLYYRFTGQTPYNNLLMTNLAGTDYYSANVSTEESETRHIEYYIQARDNGGNRAIKGFAFEPFVRHLAPAQPGTEPAGNAAADSATQTAEAAADSPRDDTGSSIKWWYVALGVLIAGGLAAAAGGGGGGGGDNTPEQVTVDVTVANPQ